MKTFIIDGNREGKTIAVVAGVHGNEKAGVEAIKSLLPFKINQGRLIFVIANEKAIEKNVRFIETDLNRLFNCKTPETMEKRIANKMKPLLNQADAMLDLHSSFSKDTFPFCICEENSVEVAKQLPGKIILTGLTKFHKGSTDEYMYKHGKIGICIECGYLNSKKARDIAKKAVRSFCIAFGIIKGRNRKKEQRILKATELYKNKSTFKLKKSFKDFEKVNCLIGLDGKEKIKAKGYILFAQSQKNPKKECFVIANEKIYKQKQQVGY